MSVAQEETAGRREQLPQPIRSLAWFPLHPQLVHLQHFQDQYHTSASWD